MPCSGRPWMPIGRRPSVVSIPAPMRRERLCDAAHGTRRERCIACELELSALLTGEDPRDQPNERPGIRAVDRSPGRDEAVQPFPEDPQRVPAPCSYTVDPERAHRRDGGLGVRRAAEPRDARLAVADRADQHRAVRDRLVARDGDVPDEPRHRLDDQGVERGAHVSVRFVDTVTRRSPAPATTP